MPELIEDLIRESVDIDRFVLDVARLQDRRAAARRRRRAARTMSSSALVVAALALGAVVIDADESPQPTPAADEVLAGEDDVLLPLARVQEEFPELILRADSGRGDEIDLTDILGEGGADDQETVQARLWGLSPGAPTHGAVTLLHAHLTFSDESTAADVEAELDTRLATGIAISGLPGFVTGFGPSFSWLVGTEPRSVPWVVWHRTGAEIWVVRLEANPALDPTESLRQLAVHLLDRAE